MAADPAPSLTHTSAKQTSWTKLTVPVFTSGKAMTCAYAFIFSFLLCTAFMVFNPSGYSFPWLSNFLTYRSQLSSIFSHFLPNPPSSPNTLSRFSGISNDKGLESHVANLTGMVESQEFPSTSQNLSGNGTSNSQSLSADLSKDPAGEEGVASKSDNLQCNIYDGRWVWDDWYPLYESGSCPFVDEAFNCRVNGRVARGYEKYRWQPNDCNIPRLAGRNMLELLRGKRLVFVGDSLNRNMWESLVCILRNSVADKSGVFEVSGRNEFRTEGSYSFVFRDYNCSVEFYRSPFLVQEWETQGMDGSRKKTLHLDLIEGAAEKYRDADILIFNTGHWWTHDKTSRGKGYYQEGNVIYDEMNVKVAFRKALSTWARWVDENVNPKKTTVFFGGYSISHFAGGRWNNGGRCDRFNEPIKNEAYLKKYPTKMRILESVMKEMKTRIYFLNITRLSAYRIDAHPSFHTKQNVTEERRLPLKYQDCSHWCLPGVPDIWNELLYVQLLLVHNLTMQQ